MDYQLVIVRGRSNSKAIKLADGVTTVGRQDECQIRIKSSQVSRRHCELFEKKGLLLVKDLGSSNGTYVNGARIKDQRVLEPGDELTLGQIKLKVAKVDEAVPSASVSKPGATASVEPITVGGAFDDAFRIDFGDESAPVLPTAPKNDQKQAEAEPAPAVAATKAPASQPIPEREPESTAADDAVADFLLTIKIDEDE